MCSLSQQERNSSYPASDGTRPLPLSRPPPRTPHWSDLSHLSGSCRHLRLQPLEPQTSKTPLINVCSVWKLFYGTCHNVSVLQENTPEIPASHFPLQRRKRGGQGGAGPRPAPHAHSAFNRRVRQLSRAGAGLCFKTRSAQLGEAARRAQGHRPVRLRAWTGPRGSDSTSRAFPSTPQGPPPTCHPLSTAEWSADVQ